MFSKKWVNCRGGYLRSSPVASACFHGTCDGQCWVLVLRFRFWASQWNRTSVHRSRTSNIPVNLSVNKWCNLKCSGFSVWVSVRWYWFCSGGQNWFLKKPEAVSSGLWFCWFPQISEGWNLKFTWCIWCPCWPTGGTTGWWNQRNQNLWSIINKNIGEMTS